MKKLELNIKKAMTMAYITKEKDVVNNSEIIHDKCSEVFCTIGPKIERRIDVIEVSNDHTLNVLGSDWPVKHIAAMGSSEIFFKNFCPFNEKRQTTIFVDKDSTIKLYGEYMNISYCILGANSHFSWEVEGGGGGGFELNMPNNLEDKIVIKDLHQLVALSCFFKKETYEEEELDEVLKLYKGLYPENELIFDMLLIQNEINPTGIKKYIKDSSYWLDDLVILNDHSVPEKDPVLIAELMENGCDIHDTCILC